MALTTDVVTTVLAAAASHDLVDLDTVKVELEVLDTSKDTWLSRTIAQTSKAIMNDTNRVFAPELVQDVFDIRRTRNQVPSGLWQLQLSRWPVIEVVSVDQATFDGGTRSLDEDIDFRVDYENGRLLRLNPDTGSGTGWEALPATIRYSAGFGTIAAEEHAVPSSSPYQVTVQSASEFSCDQSVSKSDGTVLARVGASPAQGQYAVSEGVYSFNAADGGLELSFSYATRTIPGDVAEACTRLVTGRFRAKGRDPNLIQRDTPGVGVERFWFGGAPGQSGPFPPDVEAMLDNYKVPVVA